MVRFTAVKSAILANIRLMWACHVRDWQLVFVGFIIYFLYHVINKIRKQKRKYFKSFWNMLELVTVIMAVLTCAMYGAKIMFGNAAMDTLRETGSGKRNSVNHLF